MRNARSKTTEKVTRDRNVTDVMTGLRRSMTTRARAAVMTPPASSTRPVPIRLRTPSTSFMIRETRVPLLLAS